MPRDHPRLSRRQFLTRSAMAVAGGVLYSCTGNPITTISDQVARIHTRWPIKRVVYLMMENRSFDNLFGRFPGANGATVGVNNGKEVPLTRCPAWLPGDLSHDYAAAISCLNGGTNDGFANNGLYGPYFAYTQYEEQDVPNYFHWARNNVLCDNFFASALGPSYPNHFFFIAGQSGGVFDNPENIETRKEGNKIYKSWGCDALGDDAFVFVRDKHGNMTKHDTCFSYETVGEQLTHKGIDWAYYAADWGQPGYFWSAYNGIGPVFHTDLYHEHVRSVDNLLGDLERGDLPAVTWITPRFQLSDHPPWSTCFAHNWITEIVNRIMRGPMWQHTAIFITWDEWGGFYDHVMPPNVDQVGLGFRVPMLVLSPYAKKGYVDDARGEFSTPLKFIADNWGLSYLTPRIADGHNFEHVFDFKGKPRPPDPRPTMKGCEGHPFEWIGHSDDWPAGIPSPINAPL